MQNLVDQNEGLSWPFRVTEIDWPNWRVIITFPCDKICLTKMKCELTSSKPGFFKCLMLVFFQFFSWKKPLFFLVFSHRMRTKMKKPKWINFFVFFMEKTKKQLTYFGFKKKLRFFHFSPNNPIPHFFPFRNSHWVSFFN